VASTEADLTVTIGAAAGHYAGQPDRRRYGVRIHRKAPPTVVTVEGVPVAGWDHDPELGGVTVVRTPPVPAGTSANITLRWDSKNKNG
jgi:hypothetical protein